MPKRAAQRRDPLEQVTAICLEFPEAGVERSGSHATFRVRKKVFAYFLDNHHGDGIVSVCCKTRLGENVDLAREDPGRFYLLAYIGPRGWVGIRLDRKAVEWAEIRELVASSYYAAAPKSLAAKARLARGSRG
jgi:predicted DNA-binding protein (MmcQ/YjbR family)